MSNMYGFENLCSSEDISHHGIKGQKWGVRRFQNPDGTLTVAGKLKYYAGSAKQKISDTIYKTKKKMDLGKYEEYDSSLQKVGSSVHGKTRYTNIDGSLNERGKLHSQNYINKEIKKNQKYYDKQIKKYQKLIDRYGDDPKLKKKFENMIKDAEKSRDHVNESLKKFGIQEILANEEAARQQALRIAGAVASGGLAATGVGLTVPAVASAIGQTGSATAKALKKFDMRAPMDSVIEIVNSTEIGRKGEQAAETAIRSYADAKAYVAAIYMDQAFHRLDQSGIPQRAGQLGASALNAAVANIDQNSITGLGNTTTNALVNLVGNTQIAGQGAIASLASTAIQEAGRVNSDYNTMNLLQQVGNMSLDQQVAVMMNDPQYLKLVDQATRAAKIAEKQRR